MESQGRVAPAYQLELTHGRNGATARIELHRSTTDVLALVSLTGWIDGIAAGRLRSAVEDLAVRGATRLLVDCARVRHVDYRHAHVLLDTLHDFEARRGPALISGLSPYVRDVIRLAGGDDDVLLAATPEPFAADLVHERERELAS